LPCGELVWGEAQKWRQQRPQIMICKPVGQESKGDQRAEQGVHTWVNEAQRRRPLTGNIARLVDLLKSIFSWTLSRQSETKSR